MPNISSVFFPICGFGILVVETLNKVSATLTTLHVEDTHVVLDFQLSYTLWSHLEDSQKILDVLYK